FTSGSLLNEGEKKAIQMYTGISCYQLNSYLNGNLNLTDETHETIDIVGTDCIAKSALVASGLNKIQVGVEGIATFRGEHYLPNEVIQERIACVQKQEYLKQAAFFSTTDDVKIAEQFSDIHYKHD